MSREYSKKMEAPYVSDVPNAQIPCSNPPQALDPATFDDFELGSSSLVHHEARIPSDSGPLLPDARGMEQYTVQSSMGTRDRSIVF